MRFLIGLIFILFLLYFLHLLLISKAEKPKVFKTEREDTQVIEEDHREEHNFEDDSLGARDHHEKSYTKEGFTETIQEEKPDQRVPDAKDYFLSAMKSYEEIFNTSDKKTTYEEEDMLIDIHSKEENTHRAILIYEEILGLDVREAGE